MAANGCTSAGLDRPGNVTPPASPPTASAAYGCTFAQFAEELRRYPGPATDGVGGLLWSGAVEFAFFDPEGELYIHYRRLPHWDQPGALCFLTWRTIDSIPENVLRRWRVERACWLRRQRIDPQAADWRERVRQLPRAARREYHEQFTSRWMECLDECHGAGVLKQPELSQVVAENLHHGDNGRYVLSDFVVMPNHVHVLVQFAEQGQVKSQPRAWKHFTAGRINAALGQSGRFWQVESFDHLVRSGEQFECLREYIARNPAVAGLTEGEYRHYRRE